MYSFIVTMADSKSNFYCQKQQDLIMTGVLVK